MHRIHKTKYNSNCLVGSLNGILFMRCIISCNCDPDVNVNLASNVSYVSANCCVVNIVKLLRLVVMSHNTIAKIIFYVVMYVIYMYKKCVKDTTPVVR